MRHTTLILGAGLGREYGFPDGLELKKDLTAELDDHETELRNIIKIDTSETVDEMAVKHPKYTTRIRSLVAKILREREDEDKVFHDAPNTYKQLLKQVSNEYANGNTVSILTFNYDRSLQFLLESLKIIGNECKNIPSDIIIPMYGRLPLLEIEDSNANRFSYNKYGPSEFEPVQRFIPHQNGYNDVDDDDDFDGQLDVHDFHEKKALENLQRTAEIKFIGELVKQDTSTTKAILEKSHQIFFLGVGYHKANMDILGFNFSVNYNDRIIAGTGYNLNPDHIEDLLDTYSAIHKIENCDAFNFLKFKYTLSEYEKNFRRSRK